MTARDPLRWVSENREAYAGQWVALARSGEGYALVASAPSRTELQNQIYRREDLRELLVILVTPRQASGSPYRSGEPLPDLFALATPAGLCSYPEPSPDEGRLRDFLERWNAAYDRGEHPFALSGPWWLVRYREEGDEG